MRARNDSVEAREKARARQREVYRDRRDARVCVACQALLSDSDGIRCPKCNQASLESHYRIIERRKLAGQCRECCAQLQDDDGSRCKECSETERIYRRRHYLSGGGAKDVERQNAARSARRAVGLCFFCREKALPGKSMCHGHWLKHREYNAQARARRKAGIVSLKSAATKPRLPQRIVDVDAIERSDVRERLLRSLSHFDGVDQTDLFDAIGVPEGCESVERNTYSVALSRLVVDGLAGRSGERNEYLYRITVDGRSWLQSRRAA